MRSTKTVSLWGPAQTMVYRLYACVIPFEITFLWQTTETKKRNKRACNKNAYPPTRGEKKFLWSAHPPENFLRAWKKPYLRKIPHVIASSCGSSHAGNGTIVPRAVLPWEKTLLISEKVTDLSQKGWRSEAWEDSPLRRVCGPWKQLVWIPYQVPGNSSLWW